MNVVIRCFVYSWLTISLFLLLWLYMLNIPEFYEHMKEKYSFKDSMKTHVYQYGLHTIIIRFLLSDQYFEAEKPVLFLTRILMCGLSSFFKF